MDIEHFQNLLVKSIGNRVKIENHKHFFYVYLEDRKVSVSSIFVLTIDFYEKDIEWFSYYPDNMETAIGLIKLWVIEKKNSEKLQSFCPELKIPDGRKLIETSIEKYVCYVWDIILFKLTYKFQELMGLIQYIIQKKTLTHLLPFLNHGAICFGKNIKRINAFPIKISASRMQEYYIYVDDKLIYESKDIHRTYEKLISLFPEEVRNSTSVIVEY